MIFESITNGPSLYITFEADQNEVYIGNVTYNN